ncbi:MAG TPA: hypothetical protein VMW17_12925 [Candidatus Binatia bacterium]|nr:hypothetical protein [Candidatus Binatia bacterium]
MNLVVWLPATFGLGIAALALGYALIWVALREVGESLDRTSPAQGAVGGESRPSGPATGRLMVCISSF